MRKVGNITKNYKLRQNSKHYMYNLIKEIKDKIRTFAKNGK